MPLPAPDQRGGTLTPQQITFFETFGFLRIPGLFADDIDDITAGFEEVFADNPHWETAEGLHFDEKRIIIPGFVEKSERLADLPDDPRVRGVVTSLLGPEFEYAQSDGNLFYCDTSWHADTYEAPMGTYHVKLSFYLDPLGGESGAIRMIPGSNHHQSDFARALRRDLEDPAAIGEVYGVEPTDVPGYTIRSEPGDLVLWSFRTVHASFGGDERRRLFSLNFREEGSQRQAA